MSTFFTISLESASNKQLLHYARAVLNLDAAEGTHSTGLRAKILQANPGCTEIQVPAELVDPASKPADAEPAQPAVVLTTHFRDDPKVELTFMGTTEPTRAKDIQIACQGELIIARREQRVAIPYRHYLVVANSVEHVARDTDEINPTTGLPIKEWVRQHAYPFQVHKLPSEAEIAAWEQRVAGLELA